VYQSEQLGVRLHLLHVIVQELIELPRVQVVRWPISTSPLNVLTIIIYGHDVFGNTANNVRKASNN